MTSLETIGLFYDGFERQAVQGLVGQARSHIRRVARYSYRTLRRKQVHTGFYTAFLGLVRSLEANDVHVRINDFAYARKHPLDPIGVAGYPSVFDKLRLDNPILFGPGDYGSGESAKTLARLDQIKVLSQPCQWAVDINMQWAGDKGEVYFAGIDTQHWRDLSNRPKTVDFLIYDKIRWHRDTRVATVLEHILETLRHRGLTYRIVRYGHHHISTFRSGLADARALLFLCEHETQGIAYQEALSSGVPVLAWDEGVPVDPNMIALAPEGFQVSSVPYFEQRCGLRFKLAEFDGTLERFVDEIASYRPRDYILDTRSLRRSGQRYLELYQKACP